MGKLLDAQFKFSAMLPKLLEYILNNGYNYSIGEAYRTPEQALIYAKAGKGIKDSLHCDRLAIDLNLFKNNMILTKSADYEMVGKYWEFLGGSWGGRFADGNHFSLSYEGRK
ncbi:M15 family metallopeptidase [Dolichospermum sp. ST_sed5]|nr:M15 family metallopeptidase [Dolichospermum sp. ST_sed5]